MPKATTITRIEHEIEALPPADQLRLLERMVKHLKRSLLRQRPAISRESAVTPAPTARGALKRYANPALREREPEAFARAMKEKHAPR